MGAFRPKGFPFHGRGVIPLRRYFGTMAQRRGGPPPPPLDMFPPPRRSMMWGESAEQTQEVPVLVKRQLYWSPQATYVPQWQPEPVDMLGSDLQGMRFDLFVCREDECHFYKDVLQHRTGCIEPCYMHFDAKRVVLSMADENAFRCHGRHDGRCPEIQHKIREQPYYHKYPWAPVWDETHGGVEFLCGITELLFAMVYHIMFKIKTGWDPQALLPWLTSFITCHAGRHRSMNVALWMAEFIMLLGGEAYVFVPNNRVDYPQDRHTSRLCDGCHLCSRTRPFTLPAERSEAYSVWTHTSLQYFGLDFNWSREPFGNCALTHFMRGTAREFTYHGS